VSSVLALAGLMLTAGAADAEPREFVSPKLLVHLVPAPAAIGCQGAGVVPPCDVARTSGDLFPARYLAYIVVVDGDAAEGIAGAQFGISCDRKAGSGGSDLEPPVIDLLDTLTIVIRSRSCLFFDGRAYRKGDTLAFTYDRDSRDILMNGSLWRHAWGRSSPTIESRRQFRSALPGTELSNRIPLNRPWGRALPTSTSSTR
jgi:hypothetical protein